MSKLGETVYKSERFQIVKYWNGPDTCFEVRPLVGGRSNFLPTWMTAQVRRVLEDGGKVDEFCRGLFA